MTPDEQSNLPVPADGREIAAGEETEITIAADEVVFHEGEASGHAFMILEGSVEMSKNQEGVVVHLADLKDGDIFGEMGVLDGSPRSATARAKTEVRLRRFDRDALMAKVHGDAAFALPIMNQLVSKLRDTSSRLAHNQFVTMREAAAGTDIALKPQSPLARLKLFFDADADINEFQPDAVEIERRRLPGSAIVSMFAILALMVSAILWASLTHMDTKVMAQARFITKVPNIVLQPVETAVIRAIHVKVGDRVKAGDILAKLDPTFAEADENASRAALAGLQAQECRLETELYGLPVDAFSQDAEINALEREVYDRRMVEYQSNLVSKEQQKNQIIAQIRTNLQDAKDMAGQVAVLREIEGMRTTLMDKGYGSKVNYLTAKNQRLAIEREQRRLTTSTQRLRHQLKAAEADRDTFVSQWRSRTAQELVNVRRKIDDMGERLKKMERRASMVSITAPADGVVLELAERSVGSVIRSAEPFVTIVPTGVDLELEADVEPKDVGQLQVGDPVRIKLDALPFMKHGMLTGNVRLIGEDTVEKVVDGAPSTAYRARIDVTGEDLRNVPSSFHLMPGMTASAEITVGKRRIITYFIYPVIRTISTSLREP